ncbi:MAG TPA: response regulator [Alphaproteobacteria bacterium]
MITGPFDVVVADISLPDRPVGAVIVELRREAPDLPILAITGGGHLGRLRAPDALLDIGADAVLVKPFGRDVLLEAVDRLLAAARRRALVDKI